MVSNALVVTLPTADTAVFQHAKRDDLWRVAVVGTAPRLPGLGGRRGGASHAVTVAPHVVGVALFAFEEALLAFNLSIDVADLIDREVVCFVVFSGAVTLSPQGSSLRC